MTVTEMLQRRSAINEELNTLADTLERENRNLTADEQKRSAELEAEKARIELRLRGSQNVDVRTANVDLDGMLREAMRANSRSFALRLMRDVQTTAALAETGIIPVSEQEMLKPLRAGLIYDKVGINIRSGLNGTLRWPKHGKASATWADEGARLTDQSIDFTALEMTGTRLGLAIPVTREELDDSNGTVQSVITEEMPQAIVDAINEAMFTTEKTYSDGGTTKTKKMYGPLCDCQSVTFAGALPTRKELLTLKSRVLGSGIKVAAPCWVLNEATKAALEDVKVDAGSGRFLCENDRIFGYPVFTTEAIGDNIAFGDWSYLAAGFFGNADLVIDPYTLARSHATDFVLNWRFGMVTLRPEAFILGKPHAA